MLNILEKLREHHRSGDLMPAIQASAEYKLNYLYGLARYTLFDKAAHIKTHCPEPKKPINSKQERETVRRIFESFKKMKQEQATHADSEVFAPSSLWQSQLNEAYAPLYESLKKGTLDDIQFFLANFGAWKEFTGIEIANVMRDKLNQWGDKRFKNEILLPLIEEWKWFRESSSSFEKLSYPLAGNQAGFWMNGRFFGIRSFFNEYYASMLTGIIDDMEHPVVADLGAGYGLLDYFLLRDRDTSTFLDFDLPETLCLAAFYLMTSWPDKKVLLYGERDFTPELVREYDLIFMPSFEMTKLSDGCIDLFINVNSLGEMNARSVNEYVRLICHASRYFFHINHEISPNRYNDNERGLLCYEYPVDMTRFRRLFRYPDMIQRNFGNLLGWDNELFMYLYERRRNTVRDSI